jgi:hypothetical protein
MKNVTIGKGKRAMDSQSYAALWGSTVGRGPLFYNVSSMPLDELDWTPEQWDELASAIQDLIDGAKRNPANFDPEDPADLAKLKRWAERCGAEAKRKQAA